MAEKKIKKVCKCEHCGNEAEMVVTCSLPDFPEEQPEVSAKAENAPLTQVKGSATCDHCGNEADMWIDL
jgi:DNA-directed RNA polymerase subunit M/transcription elongation factor TFIIS